MTLLQVQDLSVRYADSQEPAVDGLSFEVGTGESVGIVGESGAGKSQTALALLGLLPANAIVSGSIRLGGTDVLQAGPLTLRKLRTRKISMVFQDHSRRQGSTR